MLLIKTSISYNIKARLFNIFYLLCANKFLLNNNINLFCNIKSNLVFNNKIFL